MLKECRLSAQAKTLHSIAGPIQQIIDHLRNGKDLKALLEKEKIRKTGTANVSDEARRRNVQDQASVNKAGHLTRIYCTESLIQSGC